MILTINAKLHNICNTNTANSPLHLKRDNHFPPRVWARKKELYAQEPSFSQEMTCFREHNEIAHKVLL